MAMENNKICHHDMCIENIEIFKDLSLESKMDIMSFSNHKKIKDKAILYSPDDKVDSILVVKKGKLKLSNYDENGKEYIYKILNENDTFGEELIFTDENYNMYIESMGDAVVCQITKDSLVPYIMKKPKFAKKLIENLGKKLKESMTIKSLLFIKDPKERLEGYLVNKCEETGSNTIRLSRETIGREINLSRETVSKKLKEIEQDKNVELIGYKEIIVKNKEKMKKF